MRKARLVLLAAALVFTIGQLIRLAGWAPPNNTGDSGSHGLESSAAAGGDDDLPGVPFVLAEASSADQQTSVPDAPGYFVRMETLVQSHPSYAQYRAIRIEASMAESQYRTAADLLSKERTGIESSISDLTGRADGILKGLSQSLRSAAEDSMASALIDYESSRRQILDEAAAKLDRLLSDQHKQLTEEYTAAISDLQSTVADYERSLRRQYERQITDLRMRLSLSQSTATARSAWQKQLDAIENEIEREVSLYSDEVAMKVRSLEAELEGAIQTADQRIREAVDADTSKALQDLEDELQSRLTSAVEAASSQHQSVGEAGLSAISTVADELSGRLSETIDRLDQIRTEWKGEYQRLSAESDLLLSRIEEDAASAIREASLRIGSPVLVLEISEKLDGVSQKVDETYRDVTAFVASTMREMARR